VEDDLTMPTIHVDGQSYDVPGDQDLLSAILSLGINLPYFCWHPAMGAIGACRQCAVKVYRDESDDKGRIVMACMTEVTDGLRVSVDDAEVVEFRRRVIEWLMTNHPHDCPVCDEGGECHLQDMTVMTGHVYRRFRYRKRTYRNQNLGPFINHEMNRCIQCYRCLRFYRDYAGGRDFDVFASKNHVYFGRHEDGPLESEFSGNLVEVCPTGVFDDKTLMRHYTRKWDLETAPSICVHCGLGCNTIPGARYEMLRRIRARYNQDINGYFLCDRGRYGYEFANHPDRIRRPRAGKDQRRDLSWDEALASARDSLAGCRRVLGVGSPRASLESNYALKALVGDDAFSPGFAAVEHQGLWLALSILRDGPARAPSLAEVESCDAILVLGTDPTNEAPMLDLAIRQATYRTALHEANERGVPAWNDYPARLAIRHHRGKLYVAAVAGMKLDAIATQTLPSSPPDLVSLAWAIEAAVRKGASEARNAPERIAADLSAAQHPLVVVSAADERLLQAAAQITRALISTRDKPCGIFVVVPECNSMGAAMVGGRALDDVLAEIESGDADGLVVVENDLFRRADSERVAGALARLQYLLVVDYVPTRIAAAANLLLPAATFAESTGTLVNNEGRAQRFFQVFVPPAGPRPSWRALGDLIEAARPDTARWASVEDVLRAAGAANPELAPAVDAAPPASWRDRTGSKIARKSHRYSGRTAETADRNVHEPPVPPDPDSPFAFTMDGFQGQPPPALTPRFWYPAWNSVQAVNKFQIEVGGALHGGPAGKRLIEPGTGPQGPFALGGGLAPLGDGEVWIVPGALIYGSEELSRLAEGVASLMPTPSVRLHPDSAAALSLAEGDAALFAIDGRTCTLPVRIDLAVARDVALVPAGYPETEGILGPCRARIEKTS
jgi:NADH-quinone oxidoreductase subunit G